MDINKGTMGALFTSYNMAFKKGFETSVINYKPFSMDFPSKTAIASYPFLEMFAGMREWIGDKDIKNIASEKLDVRNRPFEDTVSIGKSDIEDDLQGMYIPALQALGQGAADLWGELAYEALVSNGNWLDGKPFFGTSRKYGDNTIANYVTTALSRDTYAAARLAMMSYKGHNDKSLKATPNLLVVGPALEEVAKKLVQHSTYVEQYEADTEDATLLNHTATPNIYFNTAELIIDPELTGTYANYWFLLNTRGAIKPVGIQKRKDPKKLIRKDKDEDDAVFFQGKLIYGVEGRGASFLTLPHLAYAGYKSA